MYFFILLLFFFLLYGDHRDLHVLPLSSPTRRSSDRLNLGSLRSAMSLTLHTHHASRIWHGRAPTAGRAGIIGLNGFISAMNKMKRGAEQDDPYSDWRSEEHTSELQSLMRISYAVFCLKKTKPHIAHNEIQRSY